MRLILTILLIGLFKADAQMVINASYPYRPYAQPAVNLLLDDYPNAAAAYSLRKLDKDYTGAAIRVRKDTTGQPEQDIFFVGNELDTASLKSFLNASSGFVTTWYDQSGNSRNATQSTQANQPSIFESGFRYINGKVAINFDGTNDVLTLPTISASISDWSFFTALNNAGNTSFRYLFDSPTGRLILALRDASTSPFDKYSFFDGSWKLSSTSATSGNQMLTWLLGTNGQIYRNGTSLLSTTYTQKAISGSTGLGGNTGAFFNGTIGDFIIYPSYQSSNRTGIESNINTYYGIY